MCRKTQIAMHNIIKKVEMFLNIRFSDLSYQSQNSEASNSKMCIYIYIYVQGNLRYYDNF